MQTGNIMLAIADDNNTIVPKHNVTPPEVILLRAFHGSGSIRKLEVHKDLSKRTNDQEYSRLHSLYGGMKTREGRMLFQTVFPSPFDIKWPTTFERVVAPTITSEYKEVEVEKKDPGYKEAQIVDGYVHIERDPDTMAPVPVDLSANDFDASVLEDDNSPILLKTKK